MSTALAAVTGNDYAEEWRYAQALAQAGLLPKQYRESPGDVLLALAYARSLDIPVAQIFTGVHVIEGRPSMSAELMGALVRRAGHRLRISGDEKSATAEIVRRDDPDFTYRARFTIDDAQRAGLLGKAVWKQYPAAMLQARAVSAVCRSSCGDVLAGVSYVPEEIGGAPDYIDEAEVERTALAPAVAPEAESADVTVEPPSDPPAEPAPKRRRRTKAEMEAARAEAEGTVEVELPEEAAEANEEPAEDPGAQTVAEELGDQWEADWLIDLEQATEAGDLAALGRLGSKASAGNRGDLLKLARSAWNDVNARRPA